MEVQLDQLRGKWVVILDERIVVSGDNVKELIEEAKKKHPNKKLVLARVPEEGTLIY